MNQRDEDEHQIDTVPPPPGEDDAYSAETRIGKIPNDLLQAMKRAHASELTQARLPQDLLAGQEKQPMSGAPVSGVKSSPPRIPVARAGGPDGAGRSQTIPPPAETKPVLIDASPSVVVMEPVMVTESAAAPGSSNPPDPASQRTSDSLFDLSPPKEEEGFSTMLMMQKTFQQVPRAEAIALPKVLDGEGAPLPAAEVIPPPLGPSGEMPPAHGSVPEVSLMHQVPPPEVLRMVENGQMGTEGRMPFSSFASFNDERARQKKVALVVGVAILILLFIVWLAVK